MNTEQLMSDFKQSVYKLTDNLPQWNSGDINRRKTAAISSLFEECGEICGLVSKYQTRKTKGVDLWTTDFNTVNEELKSTVIEKFMDETGDFLWVSTAAMRCALDYDLDICNILVLSESLKDIQTLEQLYLEFFVDTNADEAKNSINTLGIGILSEIIDDIHLLFVCDNNSDVEIRALGHAFMTDICAFLTYLKLKYDISLDDILLYNMKKLGVRYDENGNRVDGKL